MTAIELDSGPITERSLPLCRLQERHASSTVLAMWREVTEKDTDAAESSNIKGTGLNTVRISDGEAHAVSEAIVLLTEISQMSELRAIGWPTPALGQRDP
jgi:hypothetical protein